MEKVNLIGVQLAAHLKAQEHGRIERALIPTMLSLALETLTTGGWEIRKDVPTLLGRSVRTCFKAFDPLALNIIATKLADEAKGILDAAGTDNVPELWQATAHLGLRMGLRGYDIDPDGLLVCTAIEMEWAEEEGTTKANRMEHLSSAMERDAKRRGWWRAPMALDKIERIKTPGIDRVKLKRI